MSANPDVRRRFQRYTVSDTVFLAFRPKFDKVGKLKDISESGVGFEYVTLDASASSKDSDISNIEVDIFSSSNSFFLSKVPCKVVYDMIISNSLGTGIVENRRCGLEFNDLSSHQAAQLGYFLDAFASEPVPYR